MVHIRQPMFSIITSIIFSVLGILYGLAAIDGADVALGKITVGASVAWALTGVMFLMAYFALVHLKD